MITSAQDYNYVTFAQGLTVDGGIMPLRSENEKKIFRAEDVGFLHEAMCERQLLDGGIPSSLSVDRVIRAAPYATVANNIDALHLTGKYVVPGSVDKTSTMYDTLSSASASTIIQARGGTILASMQTNPNWFQSGAPLRQSRIEALFADTANYRERFFDTPDAQSVEWEEVTNQNDNTQYYPNWPTFGPNTGTTLYSHYAQFADFRDTQFDHLTCHRTRTVRANACTIAKYFWSAALSGVIGSCVFICRFLVYIEDATTTTTRETHYVLAPIVPLLDSTGYTYIDGANLASLAYTYATHYGAYLPNALNLSENRTYCWKVNLTHCVPVVSLGSRTLPDSVSA